CEEFQRRSSGSKWLRSSYLEGGIGISSCGNSSRLFENSKRSKNYVRPKQASVLTDLFKLVCQQKQAVEIEYDVI
ncbi:hypothetical protein, partial [Endozoicomonas sp. ONNA2]|uniref:hypothetical protein n=1 Tax=Endozoicomonas sp. ONNA2 TaxID=2828741 RepID=UPI00214753A6